MKILGINTSLYISEVSIIDENNVVLGEYRINSKNMHSAVILKLISSLIDNLNLKIKDINLISVACGPGSYIGIRVGSSIAKGISYGLNIPITSVSTLEALSLQINFNDLICPIINAKNNNIYSSIYEGNKISLKEGIYNINDFIEEINKFNKDIKFIGYDIDIYKEIILKNVKKKVYFVQNNNINNIATSVARLGFDKYKKGKIEDTFSYIPKYIGYFNYKKINKSEK